MEEEDQHDGAPHSMDLNALAREHLEQAHSDALRELLGTFVDALMSAEAQVLCNPSPTGER